MRTAAYGAMKNIASTNPNTNGTNFPSRLSEGSWIVLYNIHFVSDTDRIISFSLLCIQSSPFLLRQAILTNFVVKELSSVLLPEGKAELKFEFVAVYIDLHWCCRNLLLQLSENGMLPQK